MTHDELIATLTDRDKAKMARLHPSLIVAYARIAAALQVYGYPIFLVYTLRTTAEQQAIYAKGRTQPGAIVTYKDGVLAKSKHQQQADGFGHAFDFAFVDDPRTPKDETFDESMPWTVAGTMGEHLGLTWGGRWAMRDLGHIEVKA